MFIPFVPLTDVSFGLDFGSNPPRHAVWGQGGDRHDCNTAECRIVQLLIGLLVLGVVHLVSVEAVVIVIVVHVHLLIVVTIPGLIHGLIVVHTGLIVVVTALHSSLHTVIHVVGIHGLVCVVIGRLHRPHRHSASLVGVHVHLLCAGWHVILCNQFGLFQVDYGVVFELLPLQHLDQIALTCVDECGNLS